MLKSNINSNAIISHSSGIKFIEECYQFTMVNFPNTCIFIDMRKIIENAKYMAMETKNADIAIIDQDNQKVYILELKGKGTTTTTNNVIKQCIDTENWVKHILFIMDCDVDISCEFFRVNVQGRSNNNMKGKLLKKQCLVHKRSYYCSSGNKIYYKQIISREI